MSAWRRRSRFSISIPLLTFVEIAIVLKARHPQSLHPRALHRALPVTQLLHFEPVAIAGLVERQQASVDRRHHFRLAPDHPATGVWRGERLQRQRLAERADHPRRAEGLIFEQS